MADHGGRDPSPQETVDGAGPDVGERGRLLQPWVMLPEEPPVLTPTAAAVLLRILSKASGQQDQPTGKEERRAA